jgi:hypothetical protein
VSDHSTRTIPTPGTPVDPSQHVFQIATGYIASTALYVAARLRIADLLSEGPRAADDLARATGAKADPLYRVLRSLSAIGVFEEVSPRVFANNQPSETMRSGSAGSTFDMALWISDPFHLRVYADAMHTIITGQPAVEKTEGVPVFEVFPRNPELSEIFNNAMTAFSAFIVPAVLEAYDFSGIGTLVDVAGGHGQLLISILQKHRGMRGVLFDMEHVLAGAAPRISAAGLDARITTQTGDFFKAVPSGGDAYIMKHIIHDWDDDRALTILRNIKSAMKTGGRVILVESVLAPPNTPDFGKLMDLEMLLLPGGRERTEPEFRALFAAAGLELTRILPTKSPLSVLEAR